MSNSYETYVTKIANKNGIIIVLKDKQTMRIDEKTTKPMEIIISITLCPKIYTIVICQLKIKLKRNLSLIES